MSSKASQITCVSIVCSAVCSVTAQRKHQSYPSLTFVRGIHRWPVDSPHKGSVRREMFPFNYVIMMVSKPRAITWDNSHINGIYPSASTRNSPGTGEFPAQMASNADNVSIWWRHHNDTCYFPWQRNIASVKKKGHSGREEKVDGQDDSLCFWRRRVW